MNYVVPNGFFLDEPRTHNTLGQLTGRNNGAQNLIYYYPTGTNNGKITAGSGPSLSVTFDANNHITTVARRVNAPRVESDNSSQERYDSKYGPAHISEGDLARDLRSILKCVETGAEVIIERNAQSVAVIRPAESACRKISECIAMMPADSTATIDPDFAKDVEAAIAAHREPPA